MGNAAPRTVLLVEDDDGIREALAEVLEDDGFLVAAARHGAEALALLRRLTPAPCLILLDLMMPVLDGLAFREAQLAEPSLKDIPVVVVSADTHAREKVRSLGVTRVLAKPLRTSEILAIARQFCAA